jgi:hypothetical protein
MHWETVREYLRGKLKFNLKSNFGNSGIKFKIFDASRNFFSELEGLIFLEKSESQIVFKNENVLVVIVDVSKVRPSGEGRNFLLQLRKLGVLGERGFLWVLLLPLQLVYLLKEMRLWNRKNFPA